MSNKAEAISYYHCTAIEDYLVSFTISQNANLLNRNGQDWDVLCDSFTICELRQMREYLYDHHFSVTYDFNECDEISCLVYDYIVCKSHSNDPRRISGNRCLYFLLQHRLREPHSLTHFPQSPKVFHT